MSYKTLSRKHYSSRLSTPVRLGVAAVAACFIAGPALSNPVNPTVDPKTGTASFNQVGNVLTVTNSNGAVIDWKQFNIAAGETTHFAQTSASSSVLNRVLAGGGLSAIYGTLSSNGRVWLVNPAGIMVGPGGQVNVAGFVASTLNISNADFLAGRHLFINDGTAKDVVNQGTITTPAGGSVYLIGSNVSNEGIITTPQGETILAAGTTVSLIDSATPGVKVDITGAAGNATNLGTITAEAGRIGIAGVIVRNSGTLNASSVVSDGGRIFLKASQDAYVDGNGRIVTTGTKGGSVEVLGNRVAVMDNASIDASGIGDANANGGSIKVGGDYQGKNPDIQNASVSYFGPNASLKADAGKVGDGGTVIVWADDTTRAYGNISARGGAMGGNGGFVETSGKRYLDFQGLADTRAPNGQAGALLLDPNNITIDNTTDLLFPGGFYGGVFSGGYGGSTITWNTINSQLGYGGVIITTSGSTAGHLGDITINASPGLANISISHTDNGGTWTTPWGLVGYNSSNSLTLLANNAVIINAPFGNAGSGAINIMAGWNGASTTAPVMNSFTPGQNIMINGGGGIVSMGPVTLQAPDTVFVNNASGGGGAMAGIDMDTGALSITTNRLLLTGGGFVSGAQARIASNGNQSFTVGIDTVYGSSGGLFLKGAAYGGGPLGTATYGGNAEIGQYSPTGSQSFTILNGSKVELRGGSNNGLAPAGQWSGDCYGAAICSSNSASIRNLGSGGQTFTFSSGGNLNIYGGSVGNNNGAWVSNNGASGTQTVNGNPSIAIYGGTSGGAMTSYGGQDVTFDNSASLESKYGGQTINATSIYMSGGSANFGGAFIGAPNSTINVLNGITMIGGTAAAPTAYAPFGSLIFNQQAIIGSENGINLTMTIGSGGLTMTGGPASQYGGSMAGIGSVFGVVDVTINSTGGITFSGAGAGYDRIGSFGNTSGKVSLTSTAGAISLGSSYINGTTGTTTLSAATSISQTATGSISGSSLTASAGSGGINLPGLNKVTTVSESTTGAFTYNSAVPVWVTSSTPASSMALTSALSLNFLFTGNLTLGSGSLFVAGTDMLLTASGNLTFASNFATAGLTAPGSILLAAGGDLTMNSSLYTVSNTLSLGAAGAVNINGSVTAYPGQIVLGAGTLNIGTAGSLAGYSGLTAVVTGDANIAGRMITGTGDLNLVVGGNLNLVGGASYGGIIEAGYSPLTPAFPDASIAVGGNITLNNGAHIYSANDVFIDLLGAASKLVLNDGTAGYAPSTILSDMLTGVVGTTYVTFLNRSSGGIVINGTESTQTSVGGSGFFAVNTSTPATVGAGLSITYAAQATDSVAAQLVNALTSAADKASTSSSPTDSSAPPPPDKKSDDSSKTAGGGEDSFGGDEGGGSGGDSASGSGEGGKDDGKDGGKDGKKDKKDKKSNEAKDGKKDGKSGHKKAAHCTA
jgi:filamentous hemagglutinin family protein